MLKIVPTLLDLPCSLYSQPTTNVAGKDLNSDLSVVELTGETLKYFDIQLIDGIEPSDPGRGSNVDDKTVSSASVLVYRDNVPLVEGVDYSFGYKQHQRHYSPDTACGILALGERVHDSILEYIGIGDCCQACGELRRWRFVRHRCCTTASRTTFELDLGYIVYYSFGNGTTADIVTEPLSRLTMERVDSPSSSTAIRSSLRTTVALRFLLRRRLHR